MPGLGSAPVSYEGITDSLRGQALVGAAGARGHVGATRPGVAAF